MTGGTVEAVGVIPVTVGGGGEMTSAGAGAVTGVITDPGNERGTAVGAIQSKIFTPLVADGAVELIFGRLVSANFGVGCVRSHRFRGSRVSSSRRIAVTVITGRAIGRHETAFGAVMAVTGCCAVFTFMVVNGSRSTIIMQGRAVTRCAEIVIVGTCATIRFVEGVGGDGTAQGSEDDISGKVSCGILGILFGPKVFYHRAVAGAVRIVAGETGLGEGGVVGFFGVAGRLVTVRLDVHCGFAVTRAGSSMARLATEATDEQLAGAKPIDVPGSGWRRHDVAGSAILVRFRLTGKAIGGRSAVAIRLVQRFTQVIDGRDRYRCPTRIHITCHRPAGVTGAAVGASSRSPGRLDIPGLSGGKLDAMTLVAGIGICHSIDNAVNVTAMNAGIRTCIVTGGALDLRLGAVDMDGMGTGSEGGGGDAMATTANDGSCDEIPIGNECRRPANGIGMAVDDAGAAVIGRIGTADEFGI